MEYANYRIKAGWDLCEVGQDLQATPHGNLNLLCCLASLLSLLDELDPKEHEAKHLIGLVHSDFFEEAACARLRIVSRLNFRVQRAEDLAQGVARPDLQFLDSLVAEPFPSQTALDRAEHLRLGRSDEAALEDDPLFALHDEAVLLAVEIAWVLVLQVVKMLAEELGRFFQDARHLLGSRVDQNHLGHVDNVSLVWLLREVALVDI